MSSSAPPWLLALETASLSGSVALSRGGALVEEVRLADDRRAVSDLFPSVAALLARHGLQPTDIDVFAFSRGPGSFTGLRVAATIARLLQSAAQCRVVAVPTLEVIPANVLACDPRPALVAPLLDAKRGQVYAALYRVHDDVLTLVEPAAIRDPQTWLGAHEGVLAVGDGLRWHAEACRAAGAMIADERLWRPRASHTAAIGARLAASGGFCAPHEITPLYLRPPECEEVYEARRAAARAKREVAAP